MKHTSKSLMAEISAVILLFAAFLYFAWWWHTHYRCVLTEDVQVQHCVQQAPKGSFCLRYETRTEQHCAEWQRAETDKENGETQ
jgi:hypothetical protein